MQRIPILTLTVAATAQLAAQRFVTHAGAPAGANANTLGVARMGVAAGEDEAVDVLGTAEVEVGAAIAVGDKISADAQGRAVVTDGTTYTVQVARALSAAGAAGERIEALLIAN